MTGFLKWLSPGMKVKRWLLLFGLGLLLTLVGCTLIINFEILRSFETVVRSAVYRTVGAFPSASVLATGAAVTALGILLICIGIRQLVRSIVGVFMPDPECRIVDVVHQKRQLGKGPKIVAIGGGTGLSMLLRGVKELTSNVTALVTVADDGGSSGRLRSEWGVLPPGDTRNCLVALADAEPLMQKLFQHRFEKEPGLEGHSFGNLFIATMTAITGDFQTAGRESSRVLAVRGTVHPSTLEKVVLCAEFDDSSVVEGESAIPEKAGRIRRVFLKPSAPRPVKETLVAIREAEAIVLGPGSLYTSIMPNLLVSGVADAIRRSSALKIYVCNVMTQSGETDGYSASDHVKALLRHAGTGIVQYVLVNNESVPRRLLRRYEEEGAHPVVPDVDEIRALGLTPMEAPLLSKSNVLRHDPSRLATALSAIITGNTSAFNEFLRHVMLRNGISGTR